MDYTEIKTKTVKELHELLAENRGTLRDLRFRASEGQLNDNSAISKTKKVIARLLTSINSREA